MNHDKEYSIDSEGYFGVTLLNIGSYASHLMMNRTLSEENLGADLHFNEAKGSYMDSRRALTVEGIAISLSNPGYAIHCLESYARIARDMDKLAEPFAS